MSCEYRLSNETYPISLDDSVSDISVKLVKMSFTYALCCETAK